MFSKKAVNMPENLMFNLFFFSFIPSNIVATLALPSPAKQKFGSPRRTSCTHSHFSLRRRVKKVSFFPYYKRRFFSAFIPIPILVVRRSVGRFSFNSRRRHHQSSSRRLSSVVCSEQILRRYFVRALRDREANKFPLY